MLGDRIQRARLGAGLSLRALAAGVGVSQTAIAKYEKEELTPASGTLRAIAAACGVKVEYFFRPDTVTLAAPEYRKRSRLGKKALAQIEANVLEQAERYLELLSLYPVPPVPSFCVPDGLPERVVSQDHVEEVACALRDAWHLGQNPIGDLTGTLEERGLLVLVTPVDANGRFDGLAAMINGVPVVVVGESWPGDRQRFTLAHELGHLVLDGRLGEDVDEEKACNRFAGAFIAPKEAVIAELGTRRTWLEAQELHALKHEYGLSMLSWVFRAKDLGVLSESSATRLFKFFSARGWRKREPGRPLPAERPTLMERLVFHALAEDMIGESKAAELMAERHSEFRRRRRMEHAGEAAHQ